MNKQGLTHQETAELCRSLSLLLHAGLSFGDGLFLLAQEAQGERRALLEEMGERTERGESLAAVMEQSGEFPVHACRMAQVGERTGHLEEALESLARYYEERAETDHRLRSALVYPALLLIMILAVVAVLLIKVLPVFSEVYASLGGELTGLAGGLLRLGGALKRVLPLLLVLGFAAAALVLAFAGSETFRARVISLWQRRRGGRGVAGKLAQAQFAEALAMGLAGGLPLEEAVRLAAQLPEQQSGLAERGERSAARIAAGAGLGETLGEEGLLPPSACRMLSVGMRSGSCERVAGEVARHLAEDAREELERKAAQIEPAMVLLASLLVGAVLLAVMLPLLNIMSAIG